MTKPIASTAVRQEWIERQLADPPDAAECVLDDPPIFTKGKHGRPIWRNRFVARILLGLEIGDPLVARHTCHNPLCINISHLVAGTPADNSADMVAAGRSLTGSKNPLFKTRGAGKGHRPYPRS